MLAEIVQDNARIIARDLVVMNVDVQEQDVLVVDNVEDVAVLVLTIALVVACVGVSLDVLPIALADVELLAQLVAVMLVIVVVETIAVILVVGYVHQDVVRHVVMAVQVVHNIVPLHAQAVAVEHALPVVVEAAQKDVLAVHNIALPLVPQHVGLFVLSHVAYLAIRLVMALAVEHAHQVVLVGVHQVVRAVVIL